MRVQVQLESTFTVDFGSVRNHVRNFLVVMKWVQKGTFYGVESRLVYILLDSETEMQVQTQLYGRRPYGVGLLIAGYDVSLVSI